MKRLFKLFVCLLVCFSFISLVHAEEEVDVDNGSVAESDEYSDTEDADDFEDWSDDDGGDVVEDWSDDEGSYDDSINEEILNQDANVENSQTSDFPIILIASIAIISLIFVLSKKNIFVNNGY